MIVVVGQGDVSAAPDQCSIHISLRLMHESVSGAIAGVSALADAAAIAVREAGIDASDVRTQNVHVQDWIDREQQRVTAHVAMYTLTVTVRDLDAVSSVVGVLAETAGDALQIQAIGFGHSDYTALLASARREAVVDARVRAEQLAEAAGVGLGEILGIDEGTGMTAGWVGRAVSGGAREMSAPAMPMTPGSQNVTARVVVTWALQ